MSKRKRIRVLRSVFSVLVLAGCAGERPAYVFCNRRETCLHANPLYDPIAPGETASASSYIWILRGGVADFERVIRARGHSAG